MPRRSWPLLFFYSCLLVTQCFMPAAACAFVSVDVWVDFRD
jgi:hypothetical protein